MNDKKDNVIPLVIKAQVEPNTEDLESACATLLEHWDIRDIFQCLLDVDEENGDDNG